MAGRRKLGEIPQIRHHTASGRAYVYSHGRAIYLGPWASAEARVAYKDFLAKWNETHDKPADAAPILGTVRVNDLVSAFMVWAEGRYRRADGEPTSELAGCRAALAPLVTAHGHRLADELTAYDLRRLLSSWKTLGQVRRTINQRLERTKRAIKWGAKHDLISHGVAAGLLAVEGLAYGEAPDNEEVQPVPLRDLARAMKHMPEMSAAMVRLEYYCGARPSEVCNMRGDQIKRQSFRLGKQTIRVPDGLLVFLPKQHKTAHRGEIVFYTLGPRAQDVLAPWLKGPDFVFQWQKGRPCDYATYWRHISEACEAAGIPHWTPNQLRHSFMTRWDALAGIEAASAAVRHKSLETSAIYIQRDIKKVGELAAKFG